MKRPVYNSFYQCFLFFPIVLKEITKSKVPLLSFYCNRYSGKKITVLKRRFVNSEQKILESKLAGNVIRKLNWENEKLFGRVIKTSQERKKEIEMGIVNIGKETQQKLEKSISSKVSLEEIPTHFLDRGYKAVPPINFLRPEKKKPLVEENESINLSSSESNSLNTNDPSAINDIDYFSDYYHDSNFRTQHTMKPPFRNVSLQEVLQFPLVNPWRPVTTNESQQQIKTSKYKEENEKYKGYPSVTNILNMTMDPESAAILEKWKKQMIIKLGEDGFQQYQQDLLDNGKSLHHSTMQFLQGTPIEKININPSNEGHWKSLQSVFPFICDVHLMENKVIHSFLMFKGVVDCVARYRDHLVVIDWKTSKKQKPTLSKTYDYPLQVAAYVGALNFDPQYKFVVNSALIVIAYEDGSENHTHFLTTEMCEYYWREFLKRLYRFWSLVDNKTG